MTLFSVNINKFATLRNARGGNMPDVARTALDCISFGAQGITVHPRPDERHIRYSDVRQIRPLVKQEFNMEGNPIPSFVDLVLEVHPDQVTLVPDAHDAITSNAGWDTMRNKDFLTEICSTFKKNGIRTSIFVDPDPKMAEEAAACGSDRIELYTESYASGFKKDPQAAVRPYVETAGAAKACGLGVNAGHDLNLDNLGFLLESIPCIEEVSIGHAVVCESIYLGLEKTIQSYLGIIRKY